MKPRRRITLALLLIPMLFPPPSWGNGEQKKAAAETLPPWQEGFLDIHHIGTGRGNATFFILPDGTSLLFDAGASLALPEVSSPAKPDESMRPGQWIGRYILRHIPKKHRPQLDYFVASHFHPDHIGDVRVDSPLAPGKVYKLSGVTDIAAMLPIRKILDRGFPDYNYPAPIQKMGAFAENYLRFVAARRANGETVERIAVGRDDQIRPLYANLHDYAAFGVRTIAANGEVWDGANGVRQLFPALAGLKKEDHPNENTCSIALRVSYGDFAYFTAGDLTSYSFDGALPWRDVLGPASKVAGPVDVATADHHGLFDGLSADVVRNLRPRAWVIPAWHITHPDLLQLERMFSNRLYPGPRDIYANGVMSANFLANKRLLSKAKSLDGHIVVRVAPGGKTFTIFVTDNSNESDIIVRTDGPFTAHAKLP